MAKHPSVERQHRTSLRKNAVNKKNKSVLRTQIKKLRGLIETGEAENAKSMLPHVTKAIDQTVRKGTIHKNTGSRYKSRLSRMVQAVKPAPEK